jgi:protein TonB
MTLVPNRPDGTPPGRRPYRPPIGIPNTRQNTTGSAIVSILVHAGIIFLLLGPIIARDIMSAENEGAGGKGPAGGGGGGYKQERTSYVEIAPPPPAAKVAPQPQVVPPPVVKPPEPQVQPVPTPEPIPVAATTTPVTSSVSAGSGSGDGSGGAGPGSGGGVGSGIGTGRGSSNGPGTGGGTGRVYPPTVTHLAMLPLPVPRGVRPYTLVAIFEVDETGKAKLLQFNETKDRDYNKKIRAMLDEIRFRPAVRADGTPVRDTAQVVAEARL